MRITQASGYVEPRDSISHDWISRLGEWGMMPLLVPNRVADPKSYLDDLGADLLVLTGGDDLGVTPERDSSETELLEHAIKSGIAVLGICRGMQLINLHFDGRLTPIDGHVASPHAVSVDVLWRDYYETKTMVNSFHAQAVSADDLGDGLVAAAHDGDGNIEAFIHQTLPMAAIMWHAERSGAPPGDRKLFESLISGLSTP